MPPSPSLQVLELPPIPTQAKPCNSAAQQLPDPEEARGMATLVSLDLESLSTPVLHAAIAQQTSDLGPQSTAVLPSSDLHPQFTAQPFDLAAQQLPDPEEARGTATLVSLDLGSQPTPVLHATVARQPSDLE